MADKESGDRASTPSKQGDDNSDDNSLEQYLSDLGIDTEGDTHPPAAPVQLEAAAFSGAFTEASTEDAPGAEEGTERAPTKRPREPQGAPRTLSGGGEDLLGRCESFLVDLLLNLGPSYAAEVVRVAENELRADIVGGDPGKLIGRGGRTLAALEYLTNAVLNKDESSPHVRVSIDVGGYKVRRDERLRGVALKAAARARKTGFAVELEPMSAAERRVIHMSLADDPAVESESSGEGRDRRVVVKLR